MAGEEDRIAFLEERIKNLEEKVKSLEKILEFTLYGTMRGFTEKSAKSLGQQTTEPLKKKGEGK